MKLIVKNIPSLRRLPLFLVLLVLALAAPGCSQEQEQGAGTPIPLPTAKVPSILEINSALTRWENANNQNYFISVEETRPEGEYLYRLVIKDGEVQAAQRLERSDGEWQSPMTIDLETAENYTADALLARILRDAKGEGPAPLNMFVTFDKISGFPTLVDAKAIPSYTEDGRLRLNREQSYTLSIAVDALLENVFGLKKNPLLTLSLSGGQDADCSLLRIFDDETSIYSDNCRQLLLQIDPPPSMVDQLEAYVAEYSTFEDQKGEGTSTRQLVLAGNGTTAPNQQVIDEVWSLALELNDLLSQPIGEGVTLLRQAGDLVIGFDMQTNLQQPASLDVQAPLYGGVSNPEGKEIFYADSEGLKRLNVRTGEQGTIIANPADTHFLPVEVTRDSHIILQRFSGSSTQPEWGWISLENRSWKPFPENIDCVAEVSSSPDGGRLAIASAQAPDCTPEAAIWILDLETGTASPAGGDAPGADSIDWSPENGELAAVLQSDETGMFAAAVSLVDPETGTLTNLVIPEEGTLQGVVWNPAADRFFYGLTGAGAGKNGLYEYDTETSENTNFLEGENLVLLDFDPTGEFLAFTEENKIKVWLIDFDQVVTATSGNAPETSFLGWIDSRTEE